MSEPAALDLLGAIKKRAVEPWRRESVRVSYPGVFLFEKERDDLVKEWDRLRVENAELKARLNEGQS